MSVFSVEGIHSLKRILHYLWVYSCRIRVQKVAESEGFPSVFYLEGEGLVRRDSDSKKHGNNFC